MTATGNEAVSLSQLKQALDSYVPQIEGATNVSVNMYGDPIHIEYDANLYTVDFLARIPSPVYLDTTKNFYADNGRISVRNYISPDTYIILNYVNNMDNLNIYILNPWTIQIDGTLSGDASFFNDGIGRLSIFFHSLALSTGAVS